MPTARGDLAPILAHHLYDFVECEHRIALDATRDRTERTPPSPAMRLLAEHGLAHESRIAEALGYERVTVEDRDWDAAAARTLELMRRGVPGIHQGVLIHGRMLAQPDLLERAPGASALGEHRYAPGDVKSALAPRSDAALQIIFAGRLLEFIQGFRPATGFVVLGDGSREDFSLDALACSFDEAFERVRAIADGESATVPFFSEACSRCRWRGTCLPELQERQDVSFVWGVTRTMHRVLRRHGLDSIAALAGANAAALERDGAPVDGLERLRRQAQALLSGRVVGARQVDLPRGSACEHFLHVESDPTDAGRPFLVAWGHARPSGGALDASEVAVLDTPFDLGIALRDLGRTNDPIYVFGGRTPRGFDRLGERSSVPAAVLGDLEGRMVDLAPWVRRAGAVPVFLHRFDEVAAIATGEPRPDLLDPEDDPFVRFASLPGADDPDAARREIERRGRRTLERLLAVRRWLDRAGGGASR